MSDETPEQPKPRKVNKERIANVRALQTLMALLKNPNADALEILKEKYKEEHPNAKSPETVRQGAYKMITPELVEELRRVLSIDPKIRTTRATIERFLYLVLGQYTKGQVKTADALRAIELLSKLVPDFKDRIGIEDLSALPETEIDERLKRLGFDPKEHTDNPSEAGN